MLSNWNQACTFAMLLRGTVRIKLNLTDRGGCAKICRIKRNCGMICTHERERREERKLCVGSSAIKYEFYFFSPLDFFFCLSLRWWWLIWNGTTVGKKKCSECPKRLQVKKKKQVKKQWTNKKNKELKKTICWEKETIPFWLMVVRKKWWFSKNFKKKNFKRERDCRSH